MKTKFLGAAAIALVALLAVGRSDAATVLYSSVTSDPSGLYTYNYLVDNTNGAGNIGEVNILVSPDTFLIPIPPLPISYTVPSNWAFYTASAGLIANPPYNECCGFYSFNVAEPDAIQAGAVLGGFSFSVYAPPSAFSVNNYFLFGTPEDIASYGFTLAPEIPETPLPAALPLFATGLGALGLLGWRRKRKAAAVIAPA